ncbi:hypothetical protein ASG20_16995 [Sphingomonas sp. Leaf198]|nr:hypothetical protein ASG20_16995 [Sphingomonas sp. Leaf198]
MADAAAVRTGTVAIAGEGCVVDGSVRSATVSSSEAGVFLIAPRTEVDGAVAGAIGPDFGDGGEAVFDANIAFADADPGAGFAAIEGEAASPVPLVVGVDGLALASIGVVVAGSAVCDGRSPIAAAARSMSASLAVGAGVAIAGDTAASVESVLASLGTGAEPSAFEAAVAGLGGAGTNGAPRGDVAGIAVASP